jgi:proteasome lid subunit RPN8/RPN11
MIRISLDILEAIARHGAEDAPNEACGYITGNDGEAAGIIRLQNADNSPEHFTFLPQEQFSAVKKARSLGLKLIAVYHTHPNSPARMSAEDIRLANDTEITYAIYSLTENRLKCFRVGADKQVTEEKTEVYING